LDADSDVEVHHRAAVLERAIRFAEAVARGGSAKGENGTEAYNTGCWASGFAPNPAAYQAAFAASSAAHCADQATSSSIFPDAAEMTSESAAEAALLLDSYLPYLNKVGRFVNRNPAVEDFQTLLGMDLGVWPDLGAPIDPFALGPLWPEGEPDWFRERPDGFDVERN
jgi:hypothetical protein